MDYISSDLRIPALLCGGLNHTLWLGNLSQMLRYLRYLRSSINTLLGEWDVASSTLKHGMHVAIAAQTDSADHQPVFTKLQTCLTWRRDGRRYYYGTEHYERVVVVEEGGGLTSRAGKEGRLTEGDGGWMGGGQQGGRWLGPVSFGENCRR